MTDLDELDEHYVNGYCSAARYLLARGLPPAPDLPAMRRMWQRRGDDQRLAIRIAETWEAAS